MSIQRTVCFKFREEVSEEQKRNHFADFGALPRHIEQIQSYHHGPIVQAQDSREKPFAFDTMHYLVFDSLDDIDIYFHHEKHQEFIRRNKACWSRVQVLDCEISG